MPDGTAGRAAPGRCVATGWSTVALTVRVTGSLVVSRSSAWQAAAAGVVNAHSGSRTRCSRAAQSPPYASRNEP